METSPGTFILFLFINVYLSSKQKISILKANYISP